MLGFRKIPKRNKEGGAGYVDIFSRNNTRGGKLGLKEVKEKMCRIQDELTMGLSSYISPAKGSVWSPKH